MKNNYLEVIGLVERLHRLFLEVIKCELDSMRVEDINNVQALVLYNLGDDQISIGELTTRGCYLGSNVSYNLKKMVQNGYIDQVSSKHDKRSYMIKLSDKGLDLRNKLDVAFDKHVDSLQNTNIKNINEFVNTLNMFEIFWRDASSVRSRLNLNCRKQ